MAGTMKRPKDQARLVIQKPGGLTDFAWYPDTFGYIPGREIITRKEHNMFDTDKVSPLLNTTDEPAPQEAADSFVIQVGTRFYGPFDSDDDAFNWATPIFENFNIKPVIAP